MTSLVRLALPSLRPYCILLLVASAIVHVGAEHKSESSSSASAGGTGKESRPMTASLRGILHGSSQEFHRYAESLVGIGVVRSTAERALLSLVSLLGQENVNSVAMFLGTVVRFLAEGVAAGLNVIAVYVAEILRVAGFDAASALPRFTPEGVTSAAQWGVLALLAYWFLNVLLRLAFDTLRHVFWLVKMAAALWLFLAIVGDAGAGSDLTAVRLGALVLGYVLVGMFTSGSDRGVKVASAVEHRLKNLEGRVRAVEKKKSN
ncbi:BRI3-binding protein-like isoform X1 [Stigmatopora argus]